MESQSVKIDRYLEELEIHRTTNKVDLIPSPYPKRFSPIPNSLDVDLKDLQKTFRISQHVQKQFREISYRTNLAKIITLHEILINTIFNQLIVS